MLQHLFLDLTAFVKNENKIIEHLKTKVPKRVFSLSIKLNQEDNDNIVLKVLSHFDLIIVLEFLSESIIKVYDFVFELSNIYFIINATKVDTEFEVNPLPVDSFIKKNLAQKKFTFAEKEVQTFFNIIKLFLINEIEKLDLLISNTPTQFSEKQAKEILVTLENQIEEVNEKIRKLEFALKTNLLNYHKYISLLLDPVINPKYVFPTNSSRLAVSKSWKSLGYDPAQRYFEFQKLTKPNLKRLIKAEKKKKIENYDILYETLIQSIREKYTKEIIIPKDNVVAERLASQDLDLKSKDIEFEKEYFDITDFDISNLEFGILCIGWNLCVINKSNKFEFSEKLFYERFAKNNVIYKDNLLLDFFPNDLTINPLVHFINKIKSSTFLENVSSNEISKLKKYYKTKLLYSH